MNTKQLREIAIELTIAARQLDSIEHFKDKLKTYDGQMLIHLEPTEPSHEIPNNETSRNNLTDVSVAQEVVLIEQIHKAVRDLEVLLYEHHKEGDDDGAERVADHGGNQTATEVSLEPVAGV